MIVDDEPGVTRSLKLNLEAAFILVVETFRCQITTELLVLGSVLVPVAVAALRLVRGYCTEPARQERTIMPPTTSRLEIL